MTNILYTWLWTAEICMQIRIPLAYFYIFSFFNQNEDFFSQYNFLCTEISNILFPCTLCYRVSSNP